jgi:formamidopyrimidine-DNA glycosylase
MPELPEVETVRRTLEANYTNLKIVKVEVLYKKMIKSPLEEFVNTVTSSRILSFGRKGKYLLLNLDNGFTIISHLRMEGKYFIRDINEELSKFTRVIFTFEDGRRLCYEDVRKFGIMVLKPTDKIDEFEEISKLGPEPFEIEDGSYLYNIFKTKSSEIKSCLLDQEIMTGLGNIYADEVLFKTKINPYCKAKNITKEQCNEILKAAKETLTEAINQGGSTIATYHPAKGVDGRFQNFLLAYGKEGQKCPRCLATMRKGKIKGRGSTYCPRCQNVALKVGITGKIASGKSTVTNFFKEKGCPTISSDAIVSNLYKNIEFKKKLIELFSPEVLNDDLSISKGYIKNVINLNPEKKKLLENLVHPLVKKKCEDFINQHMDEKIVVVEVPLLFEAGFENLFDIIIGVQASSLTQINHLEKRHSLNVSKDLKLNESSKFDQNAKKCDYLIDNNGSLLDLKLEVDKIYLKILNS